VRWHREEAVCWQFQGCGKEAFLPASACMRTTKHPLPPPLCCLRLNSRALVASERLHLPPELWVQTLQELLVPVATGKSVGQAGSLHCSSSQHFVCFGFVPL
jgi:hypothetical protein